MQRAFEEIDRVWTKRRSRRAGVFLDTMVQDFYEAEMSCEALRSDGFMKGETESDFASVLERSFSVAISDVTGNKARHLGHLTANLAYRSDIVIATALHLIKVAEDLDYHDYCLLAMAKRGERFRPDRKSVDYLILLNMMDRVENTYRLLRGSKEGLADVSKTTLKGLSPLGEQLYDLLELDELHQRDVDEMVERFVTPSLRVRSF